MASFVKTVWGIDIGQCALKAIKLRNVEGEVRLEAFDVIEHPKILTQPDADRPALVRLALEQFLARNNVEDAAVVVSAPGQSGFTRFVKLPPVEEKQIPEIVRFEAEQQIPFAINDVIWQWQAFQDPDSPDVEVGIFAMKRADVANVLDRYTEVGISVDTVQMAPLALYNFMEFDGQTAEGGATLLVDVGADKTDLVIYDGSRIWLRTIQLGGNNFTDALVKAFKLSFSKAEKLKRTAASNKHARHIFQAMRPVFAELVQEIQRSIGFYTALHRETRFKKVVGLGNGFRLPGLQKFLEQNLGLPVARIDNFNKLSPSAGANAPAFTENVLSFAVSYGLALQGLGLTRINTNLLPREISTQRRWSAKQPWFAAAALLIVACCSGYLWGAYRDKTVLDPNIAENQQLRPAIDVVKKGTNCGVAHNGVKDQAAQEEKKLGQYFTLLGYRNMWPVINQVFSDGFARTVNLDQQALLDYSKVKELKAVQPRSKRRVILFQSLAPRYMDNAAGLTGEALHAALSGGTAGGAGPMDVGMVRPPGTPGQPVTPTSAPSGPQRGFLLTFKGTTPMTGNDAINLLDQLLVNVRGAAQDYPDIIIQHGDYLLEAQINGAGTVRPVGGGGREGREGFDPGAGVAPGTTAADPRTLDPLTGESIANDTRFTVGWVVLINGDGSPDQVLKAITANTAKTGGAK